MQLIVFESRNAGPSKVRSGLVDTATGGVTELGTFDEVKVFADQGFLLGKAPDWERHDFGAPAAIPLLPHQPTASVQDVNPTTRNVLFGTGSSLGGCDLLFDRTFIAFNAVAGNATYIAVPTPGWGGRFIGTVDAGGAYVFAIDKGGANGTPAFGLFVATP